MPGERKERRAAEDRDETSLDLLVAIARSRLDTQLAFLDSLDTKLGLFLSVGSATVAVAGAIVTVEHSHWANWTIWALAATVALFLGLAYFTIVPLRLQRWGIGPTVESIATRLLRQGQRQATKTAINTLREAFDGNLTAYDVKVAAVVPAAVTLALETVAAAAALASVSGH